MDAEYVRYKSKVDLWLFLLILLNFLAVFYFLSKEWSWIAAIINVGVMGSILYLLFNISYDTKGEDLLVNYAAFYQKRIKISAINRIKETRSPLGAPAASLDRLEIWYNTHSSILVSPKDKIGFIEHLKALSPKIEVQMKKQKQKND
ncbi:PH domain-containing protein [Flagellimonas pacifica]|uniref:PH domain-containing protein n=1 Tax=Flagellimonas pacifica TaxID=1247520 RepID=A0A285MXW0_9FLAO|nr:PH domain-containing protein [Allomuricauda parva]SNZ00321.1 PH domain-containing protein [Allomuricauda parva]